MEFLIFVIIILSLLYLVTIIMLINKVYENLCDIGHDSKWWILIMILCPFVLFSALGSLKDHALSVQLAQNNRLLKELIDFQKQKEPKDDESEKPLVLPEL